LGDLPALEKIEIIDCDIKTIPPSIQRLVDSRELTLIKTKDELIIYEIGADILKRKKPRRQILHQPGIGE
jgi:Leucine-rich repeat (LRR) protein